MADNTFDSEELDIQFQPITAYIDGDGSFKLNTPMLSSLDFDGSIPKVEDETLLVTDVMPGYFIKLEEDGDYFVVESVEVDEEFIDSTGLVTINYIDDQGQIISVDYDDTDTVHVMYEDWDEKILGTRGWGITSGGNAIFTNVAVRGAIEAQTLDVGGADGITYDGTDVVIGTDVTILGSLTIGDVSDYLNDNNYATDSDLAGYIPDGAAASDIVSYGTTITGGNISTGTISSQNYSYTTGYFSNYGMKIGLDGNGYIRSPNFYFDTSGNAYFKGDISAATGTFTGDLSGADISGGTITGTVFTSNSISGKKIQIGATFTGVTDSRLVFYDDYASTPTQNRFWQLGMDSNRDLVLSYDQAYSGTTRKITVNADFHVVGLGNVNGNGSGLYGTANSLNVNYANSAGSAATATTATTATTAGTAGGLTGTPFISISPYSFSNTQTDLQIRTSDGRVGIFTSRMDVKTNIVPLSGVQSEVVTPEKDGLGATPLALNPDDIFNVTPIQYNPIDDPEHLEIGFIVEDLLQKWPAAVTYDADGNPLTYNTTPIVAGLVYAVKTLKNKVDSLESRVIQLESQLGG